MFSAVVIELGSCVEGLPAVGEIEPAFKREGSTSRHCDGGVQGSARQVGSAMQCKAVLRVRCNSAMQKEECELLFTSVVLVCGRGAGQ